MSAVSRVWKLTENKRVSHVKEYKNTAPKSKLIKTFGLQKAYKRF